MMDVVDLLVEADYWACDEGSASREGRRTSSTAIEKKVYRSNLIEERVQEFIAKGVDQGRHGRAPSSAR